MHILGLFSLIFGTGGIERVSRHVCLALSRFAEREGHQVSFLSLMDQPDSVDDRYLEGDASFRGFGGNKVAFVAASLRALKCRPDIVYIAHVNLAPLGLVMQLLRPSLRYGVALYGIEVWQRLSLLKRYALRQASFATALSTYTGEQAIKLQGLEPEKIHLVPPALDPFWMSTSKESLPERRHMDLPDGKILLSVARLAACERYKGVDCVIQAMPKVIEQVPDAYYVVVGDGDDLGRLQSLAKREEVEDRVRFVGSLSEETLRRYYGRCDLFAMPSKGEGFGIVFLEAMLYKKAVIAGNHGGSRDIVDAGRTGLLVKHGDVAELSEAITDLLCDDYKRLQMGRAGYERLIFNYTYEHFREKLVNVIQGER